jgi:hypothetical protein
MALAIFGISNSGLNLAVTLFILMIVVVWLALIVYTYLDARRRISDPFLVACATVGSFFPYIGTAVYAIVRPPEFLEDAHERELEIRAAELKVRQLTEASCPKCEYPVEKSFLRCPQCQSRLKDPCKNCGKPVDPRWALCPYCETAIAERPRRKRSAGEQSAQRGEERPKRAARSKREEQPKRRPAAKSKDAPAPDKDVEAAPPKRTQRSPAREPDADPRKA